MITLKNARRCVLEENRTGIFLLGVVTEMRSKLMNFWKTVISVGKAIVILPNTRTGMGEYTDRGIAMWFCRTTMPTNEIKEACRA